MAMDGALFQEAINLPKGEDLDQSDCESSTNNVESFQLPQQIWGHHPDNVSEKQKT